MLPDPLDEVLGTRTKVRLLRALVPLARPVSGREAARLAGVSHIAHKALEELRFTGVLNHQEATGQHLYTLNRRHYLFHFVERLFEAERGFAPAISRRLREALEGAGSVEGALVFGSSARGEARPGSDLDLLVVVRRRGDREGVQSALVDLGPELHVEYGVRLSAVIITLRQLRKQTRELDPFIGEVRADGRTVMGRTIEDMTHG